MNIILPFQVSSYKELELHSHLFLHIFALMEFLKVPILYERFLLEEDGLPLNMFLVANLIFYMLQEMLHAYQNNYVLRDLFFLRDI